MGSTPKPDLKAWMESTRATEALNRFQDSTWASLNKYSHTLGWGLSGIQPECWMLLDSAVVELKKRREGDEQLVRILTRMRCGCLCLDCTTHGSYVIEDIERASGIVDSQRLFP